MTLVLLLTLSAAWCQAPPPAPALHQPRAALGEASPPALHGQAALLMDATTGTVLCRLRADERMYPASLTKLLTILIALERLDLDQVLTVSPEAAAVGHSSLYLKAGQRVTARDLIAGALLKSANDAAAALACHLGGSEEGFAEVMNHRARELGLTASNFTNPHGLHHPEHYSTATDMARLAQASLAHPQLRALAGEESLELLSLPAEQRRVWNQNRLVRRWDQCTGLKTGYTRQAGNCIAASAAQGGWDLICVVLNSRDIWTDSRSLLEWGFANFQRVTPSLGAADQCAVPVHRGARDYVPARLAPVGGLVLPRGRSDWQVNLHPEPQEAPVAAGQRVGFALISVGGQPAERVPLLATEEVPRPTLLGAGEAWQWPTLILAGIVLAYGAAHKTSGSRRRRLAPRQRATHRLRPGDGQWGGHHRPRLSARSRPQPGAPRRARAARTSRASVRAPEQAPRSSKRQAG